MQRVTDLPSQLGRLNLLTPRRRAAAAKLVSKGEVVNLKQVVPGKNFTREREGSF